MRARAVFSAVAMLLLAGCASAPAPEAVTTPGSSTPTVPQDAGVNGTAPQVDPRMQVPAGAVALEVFTLTPQGTLAVLGNATPQKGAVPDQNYAGGIAAISAKGFVPKAWLGPPARRAFTVTHDIKAIIVWSCDQPAVTATQPAFTSVGGWLGSATSFASFASSPDAPDRVEAGTVYRTTLTFKLPAGGLFLRAGDTLGLHAFLGYQGPGTCSYLVGGDNPARIELPHVHHDLVAPRETKLEGKSGELKPNPTLTGSTDSNAVIFPLKVPTDAVWVIVTLAAQGTGPGNFDADLALTHGGTIVAQSTGPLAKEQVILGPMALAGGRDFDVRVSSASATAGTFAVTVAAFSP